MCGAEALEAKVARFQRQGAEFGNCDGQHPLAPPPTVATVERAAALEASAEHEGGGFESPLARQVRMVRQSKILRWLARKTLIDRNYIANPPNGLASAWLCCGLLWGVWIASGEAYGCVCLRGTTSGRSCS